MRKFVCSVCGYVFDEARDGSWDALPDSWTCPLCGAAKSEFREQGQPASAPASGPARTADENPDDMKEMTALEVSILCSNLARGCEKQYRSRESALFTELADYFRGISPAAQSPAAEQLATLVEKDLNELLPAAADQAKADGDRGALRALTWSDKVTRIQKSLLARRAQEGDRMTEGTGVYVCTICGFVFIGDTPPALCPVCKVPAWKFERIEGRA